MIPCKLRSVREWEAIPYLNKTNKTRFGHYMPISFPIKGYGKDCWVVAANIDIVAEEYLAQGKTMDEIVKECIEYLNTPPKSKYGKKRKRKPLYGKIRKAPHSYKVKEDYIQALLIIEEKKNKNFWGQGKPQSAYSCRTKKYTS